MTVTCKTKLPKGSKITPLIKPVWIKNRLHWDITIGYYHERKSCYLYFLCAIFNYESWTLTNIVVFEYELIKLRHYTIISEQMTIN